MTRVIEATFDGTVFRPTDPVELPPDSRWRLIVEPAQPEGLWSLLQRAIGSVEAPADWSEEHDHYLYGTDRKSGAL